ncbi:LAS seventeen-binding protein 5, partial [Phenoliferia sp. Uapishka_3]
MMASDWLIVHLPHTSHLSLYRLFLLRTPSNLCYSNAVAKQAFALATQGNEKPHSAVSAWIDTLCLPKYDIWYQVEYNSDESCCRYDEEDYEGIPELVESINLQSTGPTEASRAIRKKLKYSNVHGQLRALTVRSFTRTEDAVLALARSDILYRSIHVDSEGACRELWSKVPRIKLMAGDPTLDASVKAKIMSVLGSWYRQFKDDPKMQLVAGLYASCGGGKKTVSRTAATEAYENQQARYEREAAERAERKARERNAAQEKIDHKFAEKLAAKEGRTKKKAPGPTPTRKVFNLQAEKPKIMASVGEGTQSAQNLINALQHVNREQESVTSNTRVTECLNKAKADRKTVVRYIQLVENDTEGDYIGTLLATNEQILTAIALYDRMSKPIELDSDDEHIEETKKDLKRQGLMVPENDGDTGSIRSKLSAFDLQDGEVDKLQHKQRQRIVRGNTWRARQQVVHPDLQDLAFGPTADASNLPSPIEPTPEPSMSHGSLSEYSDGTDYSSSDGEDYRGSGAPPTSASAASAHNARSYSQYIQQEDEHSGKGKGLLDPEEDPFADPFDDDDDGQYSVNTPGVKERLEWKEV